MILKFLKRACRKGKKTFLGIFFPTALRIRLLEFASRSQFFSSIVALSAGWFGREAKSVLRGQLTHLSQRSKQDGGSVDGAEYTLRRNIHRLEKGMIMRPRRPVFALDYIQVTVDVYETVLNCQSNGSQVKLPQWAYDVLTEYFSIVTAGPTADSAKEQFQSLKFEAGKSDSKCIPYRRSADSLNISIEDLKELAIRRRSCRWFLQKPVPREMIDNAIEVGGFAPSACNRQPFRFRVYDNSQVQSLAAIPMGTKGFADNFPCLVVIVGTHSAFPFPRDRHLPHIDSCLAAMGVQFALEVQGLSSCCINWPDIPAREAALRERIELADHEFVIMFMAVGFPDSDGMVPYSQKKPLDLLRSYNEGLKC